MSYGRNVKFGGIGKAVGTRATVFPWKGHDPRETDWLCEVCSTPSPLINPPVCFQCGANCNCSLSKEGTSDVCRRCGFKRVFTVEEEALIEAAERAGELVFSGLSIYLSHQLSK